MTHKVEPVFPWMELADAMEDFERERQRETFKVEPVTGLDEYLTKAQKRIHVERSIQFAKNELDDLMKVGAFQEVYEICLEYSRLVSERWAA